MQLLLQSERKSQLRSGNLGYWARRGRSRWLAMGVQKRMSEWVALPFVVDIWHRFCSSRPSAGFLGWDLATILKSLHSLMTWIYLNVLHVPCLGLVVSLLTVPRFLIPSVTLYGLHWALLALLWLRDKVWLHNEDETCLARLPCSKYLFVCSPALHPELLWSPSTWHLTLVRV